MSIFKEYTGYSCYNHMDKDYQVSFNLLAEHYGEKLNNGFHNRGVSTNGTLYTLHDFDHHCVNIMKIISTLFFDNGNAYKDILSKELYILNLSILFHDISMSTNNKWKREIHSRQSAEYVDSEYKNHSSVLYSQEKYIRIADVDALKHIILAHSDIKDGTVDEVINGLNNPSLLEYTDAPTKIRSKLLAGILRIADGLDITNSRLGHADFEEQLNKTSENASESESYKHWERLHYFSSISINSKNTSQADIIIDDEYVLSMFNQGDQKNVVESIVNLEDSLNMLLEETTNTALVSYGGYQSLAPIQRVKMVSSEQKISEAIISEQKKISIQPYRLTNLSVTSSEYVTPSRQLSIEANTDGLMEDLPVLLSDIYQERITFEVNSRNLLKGGHYPLNEKYCACDWIDTHDLIETDEISEFCVKVIIDHIRKNIHLYKNCLFLGLDIEGTLLASKIAFQLQQPFSYVIPATSFDEVIELEKELDVSNYSDIIIITDAIATWETINAVISHNNIVNKVACIYTVFYRIPISPDKISNALISKTFSLNNEFPINIINRCERANTNYCISSRKKREV